MNNTSLKAVKRITLTALFAALCYVGTVVIQIPSPTEGYLNLGDCFVLLSGWLLGPLYGALAAGIGSALADVLTGYAHYAIATFIIKALMAAVCWLLFRTLQKAFSKPFVPHLVGAVAAELIMVAGYFLFSALIRGSGWAAALGIPGNLIQGAAAIVSGMLVVELLTKAKVDRYLK